MTRRFFLVFLCMLAAGATAAAQSKPTVVILVRHAEKATVPADDPPLTPAGATRAAALATLLRDAGVTAVIATPLIRTQETARPLASALGITMEIVPLGASDAHAKAVANAVRRHSGQTVLVVGHSNTIPAIIFALGGPPMPDICDSQYSDLFTLVLDGPSARLVRSSFGASSPDPAPTCSSSMKR